MNMQFVLEDIRSLRNQVENVSFGWVNRSPNKAAHVLCKRALKRKF